MWPTELFLFLFILKKEVTSDCSALHRKTCACVWRGVGWKERERGELNQIKSGQPLTSDSLDYNFTVHVHFLLQMSLAVTLGFVLKAVWPLLFLALFCFLFAMSSCSNSSAIKKQEPHIISHYLLSQRKITSNHYKSNYFPMAYLHILWKS